MRQVAIFSDIHANLPALQAVLNDMDQRSLQERYCLGDLVGYGTFPNEVIAIIREKNIPTIMGKIMTRGSETAAMTAAVLTKPLQRKRWGSGPSPGAMLTRPMRTRLSFATSPLKYRLN